MNREMTNLAKVGVDCLDPGKYKSDEYRDYIKERKTEQRDLSLKEQLCFALGINEKIKTKPPLIHRKQKTTRKVLGQKNG